MKQDKIKQTLEEIHKDEVKLLTRIHLDIHKEKFIEKEVYREVEHFAFDDFARIVIGCSVFTLLPLMDMDVWNAVDTFSLKGMIYVHIFFCICIIFALNYEYRSSLRFDFWFIKMLLKQFFYTYVSVFMVMSIILILMNRMSYDFTIYNVARNILCAESGGLFAATAFSFLKKR